MNITTIGIDLAKNAFQVHCVDEHGKRVLNKKLKREQVVPFFSNRPACLIGMEACGSAHYWAGKLQALGHTQTDGTAIRQTLCQNQQERCGRCRSYLRGGEPSEHALRAN